MTPNLSGFIRKGGLLSALIAAIFAPQAFAVPAGRVDFALGKVSATGPDGATRDLVKGAEVNTGDSINTGAGRIQIRFTDGAYMSLQPNTVFKVENYAFNGKADGEEKGVFSLVTGGLRTISGLIGKGKRENYELRTKTATIGIRGTAYSATQNEDTLRVTVGQGSIAVTSQGGSLTIGTGQSAVVRSPQASPEMSNEKALAPKSETKQQESPPTEQAAAAGEQRTDEGKTVIVEKLTATPTPTPVPTPTPTPPPAPTVLVNGSGFALAHAASSPDFSGTGPILTINGTSTFDAAGTLLTHSAAGGSLDFSAGVSIPAPDTGSDALIGWGRWTGTVTGTLTGANGNPYVSAEGLHYVTGIPSALASLNLGSNAVVDYTMFGHTTPSAYFSGATSSGSVSGISVNPAKVTVTFSTTPTMLLGFTVTTSITSYTMTNFGNISLSMSNPATFTGAGSTNTGCITACTLNLAGLFTGTAAERLGIAYYINDGSTNSQVKGAAVFKAP